MGSEITPVSSFELARIGFAALAKFLAALWTIPPDRMIELVGIWFAAIATFLATLVALFLPKLYRPRLSVSCNKDGIGSSSYMFEETKGRWPIEELWIKVGVKNTSSLNAEDVQLRLILTRNKTMPGRRGYQLFSSWWLKVSALNTVSISIPPKYTQYFDICYLAAHRDSRSLTAHLLAVRPPIDEWQVEKNNIESDQYRTLQPQSEYDIVFAVSGKNTHAGYFQISVSYDAAIQSDGPNETGLRSAIKVSPPKRVRSQIELDELPDK